MRPGRSADERAIVERGILEDQTTEVAVSSNDVVGLFFLTEFVSIVLRLSFGCLADERGLVTKRTVHCTEEGTAEHTGDAEHVERDA